MRSLVHLKSLGLAFGIALLVAAALVLFRPQADRLARYKTTLRAQGERLSLAELEPRFSESAAAYQRQLNEAAGRLVMAPIPPWEIEPMKKTAPGVAQLAWKQPNPMSGRHRSATWEAFNTQMDEEETTLVEIRALLGNRPAGSAHDLTDPLNPSHQIDLVRRRRAAQTLTAAVVRELNRGRLDASLTNLHALINLARAGGDGGLLVDRMIHVAICSLGLSVTWETLQAPGWDEPRLAALQSDWEQFELVTDFARTVERERALALAVYQTVRTNKTHRSKLLAGGTLWQMAWSEGDELSFLETTQLILEGAREAYRKSSYQALRAAFAEVRLNPATRDTRLNRFRFQLTRIILPNWEKAALTLMRIETTRQLAVTAVAIKRHQLKYGAMPENLAQLVPDFLRAEPRDFMNGQHLVFRRNAGDEFALYSSGENGQDDGGRNDDIVWPRPERELEAATGK